MKVTITLINPIFIEPYDINTLLKILQKGDLPSPEERIPVYFLGQPEETLNVPNPITK